MLQTRVYILENDHGLYNKNITKPYCHVMYPAKTTSYDATQSLFSQSNTRTSCTTIVTSIFYMTSYNSFETSHRILVRLLYF